MLNTFSNLARFIENFNYFRSRGCDFREAWHLAQVTLP
jgi:hypothetical protein